MNNEDTRKLSGVIQLLLDSSSRINQMKSNKYWYPLSMAIYGMEEILEAIDSLCSFNTTMCNKCLEFEKNFSEYLGATGSVMVNSGSSADLLLCHYLTNPRRPIIPPGSEILVPVLTWPTQIWSVLMAGMKVRLVDVDPLTLNIDIDDMERKIGCGTRGIFLVHLMGNPCNMDAILSIAKKNDLVVIEDCCEALGSEWDEKKTGTFGIGSSYSFFFSHHITTMEGGMIACTTPEAEEEIKILRAHGWARNTSATSEIAKGFDVDPRFTFVNWGFNVRPMEIQGGMGLRQLEKLPAFNARRKVLAERFFGFVKGTGFLSTPAVHPRATPCWFSLPLMVSADAPFSRDELTATLEADGVETRPIVAGNLARHPVCETFDCFMQGGFPGADAVHERGFYIGLSPFHSDANMDRLMELLSVFLKRFK